MDQLAHVVAAVDLGVDGALDIAGRGGAIAVLAGPIVGLAQDIEDVAETRRQALDIVGEALAVFDDARHSRAIEGAELVLLGQRGDQAAVIPDRFVGARHDVLEFRLDLEKAAEIGIERAEEHVKLAVADENDLDVERDRLRVERDGGDEAHQLAHRFDADLLGA